MNNKTIIYTGGFILPDKNAAANRVVSNGKLFYLLGCKTVFLGLSESDKGFEGARRVDGRENMFEQTRPLSTKQWIKRLFDTSEICLLAEKYNADMVVLYNLPFFTLCRAKKALSKKNTEVAYDCTEWTKDTDGSFIKRAFKVFDEFLVRNFAHKIADRMIVISSTMEKKYSKNKKLLVLPPLVDINDPIWHQNPQKDNKIFEFCFAGVPDGNKESLDKVVEAFACIEDKAVRLKIVGITEKEYISIYGDIPDNAVNNIEFLGKRTHEEAIKHVLGCDCYIFIRRSDRRNNAGFPTKFAEAFTCRVPIITTDVSDVGEYIKKSGRGIVLECMSSESIAKAMCTVINNKRESEKTLDASFHYETYRAEAEKWLG